MIAMLKPEIVLAAEAMARDMGDDEWESEAKRFGDVLTDASNTRLGIIAMKVFIAEVGKEAAKSAMIYALKGVIDIEIGREGELYRKGLGLIPLNDAWIKSTRKVKAK